MNVNTELSDTAILLGEPARILMLWSLLDGQARPAGELAFFANVSPQSASLHLAKLVKAGMLSVAASGRHRYYTISRPEVAHVVESMAALTPSAVKENSLPRSRPHLQTPDFRIARTCYDHLAGKAAIGIAGALQNKGIITVDKKDFTITKKGIGWLREFNIEIADLKQRRRAMARKCLDWSERQYHIAGALGEALLAEMLRRKWLSLRGDRVVGITLEGRKNLHKVFGVVI
jgi:DNA-binding transcriptional ArsR family regulator